VSSEVARCKALGITRFLRKPIKQSELFNAIMTATGTGAGQQAQVADDELVVPSEPAGRLHVLVAEDHPINQTLVKEILSERGHSFAIANNGLEALRLLDRQSFDVILMDGQMPEMDGYQATAEIRRRERATGRHIRIIALTAHAMNEDRDRCLAVGMDDYLSKPLDPDLLIERLEAGRATAVEAFSKEQRTEPVSDAALPAFDLDRALERARNKPVLLKNLVHAFLQAMPESLADIDTAVALNDATKLAQAAHRLRGAAVTICAEPMALAAKKLEQIGTRNESDRARETFRELQARASELISELEAFVGDAQ
jgi:two-component system sensor histidine kinase/response regulator